MFYYCATCSETPNAGCCGACATICHAGHQILLAKGHKDGDEEEEEEEEEDDDERTADCYCDCGSGELKVQCKAISNELD